MLKFRHFTITAFIKTNKNNTLTIFCKRFAIRKQLKPNLNFTLSSNWLNDELNFEKFCWRADKFMLWIKKNKNYFNTLTSFSPTTSSSIVHNTPS